MKRAASPAAGPKPPAGTAAWSCRRCGCTWERACPGGCAWIGPRLCDTCGTNEELTAAEFSGSMLREGDVGLTMVEIAKALGVSEPSLRVRVWNDGMHPDYVIKVRRHKLGIWNRDSVALIKALLKAKPVGARPGPRKK